MGSLGAGRLNARSDLDLIVIYDAQGIESSDGPRPLLSRVYYARLTQALITALSAPMSEGRLFEVDMRLRPSGNKGPVATSLDAFRTYQSKDAWVWEHLALTRARVIASGDPTLGADIETFRAELLARSKNRDDVLRAVAQMRARLADAKGHGPDFDAKTGPGRLLDIELLAQTGAYLAGSAHRDVAAGLLSGAACGVFSEEDAAVLAAHYDLLAKVQVSSRLLTGQVLDADVTGQGGSAFVSRNAGVKTLAALKETLAAVYMDAQSRVGRAIPAQEPEHDG